VKARHYSQCNRNVSSHGDLSICFGGRLGRRLTGGGELLCDAVHTINPDGFVEAVRRLHLEAMSLGTNGFSFRLATLRTWRIIAHAWILSRTVVCKFRSRACIPMVGIFMRDCARRLFCFDPPQRCIVSCFSVSVNSAAVALRKPPCSTFHPHCSPLPIVVFRRPDRRANGCGRAGLLAVGRNPTLWYVNIETVLSWKLRRCLTNHGFGERHSLNRRKSAWRGS
jgi:hypothetical protein